MGQYRFSKFWKVDLTLAVMCLALAIFLGATGWDVGSVLIAILGALQFSLTALHDYVVEKHQGSRHSPK